MKWKIKAIILTAIVLIFVAGCTGKKADQAAKADSKKDITVNIGIQQSLGPLLIAKEKGWFEKEFAKVGVKVKWTVFQSGPPHFEAMAANRLDFGAVGNSPVIAAQAAGISFKEIATTQNGLKGNAILVPKNSPLKSLKDLKGKKVAVAKGSSGFALLYQAIDHAGLSPNDVQIIQLQPDEALPAFESGAVDAWSIWEPFISQETLTKGARILADGKSLNSYSPGFVIARSAFTEEHPDLTVLFLKVYEKARLFEKDHREEAVTLYANAKKIDKSVIRSVIDNNQSLNLPTTDQIIKSQQDTADFQYKLKAITAKIDTSKVVDNTYINQALKEIKAGK